MLQPPTAATGFHVSEISDDFIRAACIPMDGSWHVTGTIDEAKAMLADHPALASHSIYTAAVLGNDSAVGQFIQNDSQSATRKGGPYKWDALTYLCFSKYLRLDNQRSAGFVSAATMLLDAGANPNTGFYSEDHLPQPIFESVLYGAAGVAHHNEMTKLLIDRGADPNDGETEYHSPEWFNNRPMEIIVESGRVAPIGLVTMLVRKLDWTDYDGVAWLLDHGADPNMVSNWGGRALDHSIGRDNRIEFIEILLDRGADPLLATSDGTNAFMRAAAAGRADVLKAFEKRGFKYPLEGPAACLEACARGNTDLARKLADENPDIVPSLKKDHPEILSNFAGAGNTRGTATLLDLGFDIEARSVHPGYKGNTPLQLAVWRDRLDTVKLLVARGASLETKDPSGSTALELARRAQTEGSEWTPHETPRILSYLEKIKRNA